MNLTQGISAAAGVICLVAAALFLVVGKRHTPRLIMILTLSGVAGIIGTPIGEKLRGVYEMADTSAGRLIGQLTGTAVAGIVALVAAYVLGKDLYDKKINKRTLPCAAVLPIAGSSVPGMVGSLIYSLISTVTGVVGFGIAFLFGLN